MMLNFVMVPPLQAAFSFLDRIIYREELKEMEPQKKKQAMSSIEHSSPYGYMTRSSTTKAWLEWTIKNFGSVELKEKKIGEWCRSPTFSAPGDDAAKWSMRLYPNGYTSSKKGFISFYVSPDSPLKSDCEAFITITLLDGKSGKELFYATFTYKFPSRKTYDRARWAIPNTPQGQFLSIENLVVRCKLKYKVAKLVPFSGKHPDLATDISRCLANTFSTTINDGDVTFIVDQKEFQAHKIILRARSPVFAAMFQHDMKEAALNRVNIVDIEPDIFQAVLRFIYSDQVDLTFDNCASLLAAADRYFIDLLKWKCEHFLIENLSMENCNDLLVLADSYAAVNLKEAALTLTQKSLAESV